MQVAVVQKLYGNSIGHHYLGGSSRSRAKDSLIIRRRKEEGSKGRRGVKHAISFRNIAATIHGDRQLDNKHQTYLLACIAELMLQNGLPVAQVLDFVGESIERLNQSLRQILSIHTRYSRAHLFTRFYLRCSASTTMVAVWRGNRERKRETDGLEEMVEEMVEEMG